MPQRNNLLSILCLVIITFLFPFSVVHAAGAGTISGKLLDGTKNNTPLAGQSVTLQVAQGNTSKDLTNVITDDQGTFSFANLATDKTVNYAIYIRYQGAQYYTDLVNLANKPVQQINLTVYEATTSTANIAVVQNTVLVHEPDAQKGILSVAEFFLFKNLDNRTYVGSLDASQGKPNALRFSLPHNAGHISLSQGFDGYQAIAVDRGFATDAAVLPGLSQFAFSFEIPYSVTDYDYDMTVVYPTVQLTMMVPTGLHASSDSLAAQGLGTFDQHSYFQFKGQTLLPGKVLHTELQGLPVKARSFSTTSSNNQLWLLVGVLVLVAILLITLFLYRLIRAQGKKTKQQAPQERPSKEPSEPRVAAPRVRKETSQERQQELLQELLTLDKSFEAGKIKKSDYQEQRAALKAQLRTLMSDDAIRKAAPDPAERPAPRARQKAAPETEDKPASAAKQKEVPNTIEDTPPASPKPKTTRAKGKQGSKSDGKATVDPETYKRLLHPFNHQDDQETDAQL